MSATERKKRTTRAIKVLRTAGHQVVHHNPHCFVAACFLQEAALGGRELRWKRKKKETRKKSSSHMLRQSLWKYCHLLQFEIA